MPLITRPTKTAGNTRYTDEVTAGATTILAAEVDADLDLAYQTIDALDDANLVAGAGIQGSKLADASIPGTKIVTRARTSGVVATGLTVTSLSGEVTLATMGPITTHGQRVLIFGGLSCFFATLSNTDTATLRVKRGATVIYTQDYLGLSGVLMSISAPALTDAPAAGTYTYTVTLQLTAASAITPPTNAGAFEVLEMITA